MLFQTTRLRIQALIQAVILLSGCYLQVSSAASSITFPGVGELKLTQQEVPETANFDELCVSEYRVNATVADWSSNDLKALSVESIAQMNEALGISPTFNGKFYFVSNEGNKGINDLRA